MARFDGRRWEALGTFDGSVLSVATFGDALLVGGEFSKVKGVTGVDVTVNHIAILVSGEWQAVGGGFDGGVNAMLQVDRRCVYIGGSFERTLGHGGGDALYSARWCVDSGWVLLSYVLVLFVCFVACFDICMKVCRLWVGGLCLCLCVVP